jgi:hypothetical protein
MPNVNVRRLATLYREGLDVYPPGMRGLAANSTTARAVVKVKPAAARQFVQWVKLNVPALYNDAVRRQQNTRTLGAVTAKPDAVSTGDGPLDKLLTTIQTLAPVYLQARAQKDVLDVQMDRMRAGLPPLRATDYAPAVQIGVDPNLISDAGERLKPFLIYGGLALAGLFVFSQLSRRRR